MNNNCEQPMEMSVHKLVEMRAHLLHSLVHKPTKRSVLRFLSAILTKTSTSQTPIYSQSFFIKLTDCEERTYPLLHNPYYYYYCFI